MYEKSHANESATRAILRFASGPRPRMLDPRMAVARDFATFVGIDLGGARGKTTAIAELRATDAGVVAVRASTRRGRQRWSDDPLWDYMQTVDSNAVIAVHAPLTLPACVRCIRPVCPGAADCVDPAVAWLRSEGERLVADPDDELHRPAPSRPRLQPYVHRGTEIMLAYRDHVWPVTAVGSTVGPVAARGVQLRRRLAGIGFALNENLIEVSPAATMAALSGPRRARRVKRDPDVWTSRAELLASLGDLQFAPHSGFSREEALGSDHVFDALLAAYTGYRWARAGSPLPPGELADDGWIWAPPSRLA